MRRRSRLLRVAKWGGVVVLVLLIATGVAGLRCRVIWLLPDGSGLGAGEGMVGASWRGWSGMGSVGLSITGAGEWLFWEFTASNGIVAAPIWLPLLAIGIATIVLWRLDRRPLPPGHCPCGYDLTGNVSGTCPECGKEAAHADP